MSNNDDSFSKLVELSRYLRSPQGCPWDREQTLETLKAHIIEEAYELVQAIELQDMDELLEELGDHLYQVVFASQIAQEQGHFDIYDVIDQLRNKLVRRHPHVFGDEKASDAEEAVKRWHSQKLKEKSRKSGLLGIPRGMPSVLRAQRVGEKVSQVGFDWNNIKEVMGKLREELSELEKEIESNKREEYAKEWGDLFFTVVNLGRHLKLDTENTAHQAIDKFIRRFGRIEDEAEKRGQKITDLTIKEMESIWQEVKYSEK